MAKHVRSLGKKKDSKEGKRKEFMERVSELELLGEIITWGLDAKVHSHQAVLTALNIAKLSTAPAKEILPKHAFTRAQRKLAEDKVIDTLAKDGDNISFQFTKRAMKSGEWVYSKECVLVLNTSTGQIECEDKKLEAHAQKLLDQAIEDRTTADITKIIQKLFDAEADLFPIRDQGGCYFVANQYRDFVSKIEKFVLQLGGRINRFPVPAGTASGDRSVSDTIAAGWNDAIDELNKATEDFDINTRPDTLAKHAQYIRECKIKVQAYATLLGDLAQETLDHVDHCDERLKKKLGKLEKDRANAPPTVNGATRSVLFGHSMTAVIRWMGSKGWKFDQAKRALSSFKDIEFSDATIRAQLHGWKDRGPAAKLSAEQEKDLTERAEEELEGVA